MTSTEDARDAGSSRRQDVPQRLDVDLGKDGRATMRRLLADYPGVVILASDDPDQIVTPTHT